MTRLGNKILSAFVEVTEDKTTQGASPAGNRSGKDPVQAVCGRQGEDPAYAANGGQGGNPLPTANGGQTVQDASLQSDRFSHYFDQLFDEAIGHYADRFDLTGILHRYLQQLSGGQQQRVSIIQQLLKGSDFLLLDEPFSGLDLCVLDKVVELLVQVSLSDELKTLIIVSHDIDTAVSISDTVFILGKEAGKPWSTLVREIDLMDRGLAWKKDVRKEKAFADTIAEIKTCL